VHSEKNDEGGPLLKILCNEKGAVHVGDHQGKAGGEGQEAPSEDHTSLVPNHLIFFSDEKKFTKDQEINRRMNRWLCSDPSEVPIIMSTKFPATVMVLGVVSNEGDVMPTHFFPKGLKINTRFWRRS
jgi:hypothetical protein